MRLVSSFIFPVKPRLFLSEVVNRYIIFTAISSRSSNNNIYITCINILIKDLWLLTKDIDFDQCKQMGIYRKDIRSS